MSQQEMMQVDRYTVIHPFIDLADSRHVYRTGDDYTYDGHAVPSRRIEELSTSANALGRPLISKIDPVEVSGKPTRLKKRGRRVEIDPLPETDEIDDSETAAEQHGIDVSEDAENPLPIETSEGGDDDDD